MNLAIPALARRASAIVFALLPAALPVPAGAAAGSGDAAVYQIQNYVHTVADMDKSIAFYRDAMGLAINPPPIGAAPTDRLSLRENLNLTTNTPGATFRPTYFRLPGHPDWGIELLQFGNIERNPVQLRIDEPGATILILQVRDLNAMLTRLKAGGAAVVTPGGTPVAAGGKTRSILLKDLDGMYIELDQTGAIPSSAPVGNIVSARVGITVADMGDTFHFYRDLMGFTAGKPRPAGNAIDDLLGTPRAEIVMSEATLPGTTFEARFLEFKGAGRHAIHPHMQDPGAPQFTIYFKDVDAAIKTFHAAGTPFLGTTTVWDPNGIIILVRAPVPFY